MSMPATPRNPNPRSRRRSAEVRAQALERLRTLISALSHSARAVERSTGITNAQLFLLQQLAEVESLSVNDLAARARTQQSTVSIVVARLVRAGLAAKHKSAADGRIAVISLTPKGRRLLRHAPVPPASALLRVIEALPVREARALADGVDALVRALDLSPPEATMLFEHAPTRRPAPPR
jgi:DNA-binding MarR family transcriptional regulator